MKRMLIATVAAAALVLTGFTARPAHAGDELVRFLAGAAALFIIGNAIAEGARAQPEKAGPPHRRGRPHQGGQPGRAITLPAHCSVTAATRGRTETFYRAQCLRNAGISTPLPRRCETTLSGPHGQRVVYSAQCLREAGFRLATR